MASKPRFWRVIFFLMSLAYLVPEIIFNAQLVSLVGLGTPSAQELEFLELFGRSMSGIGVTLLVADLMPSRLYKGCAKGAATLSLIAMVVWPTVFYGQKYLIEALLIQPSPPQERQFALLSAALRDALASNAVEVTGLEYDVNELESSENLTFLALFGGLTYADNSLANNLSAYKETIIRRFITKRAYDRFEQHYLKYEQLYEELSLQYVAYAKGSNKYNETLAGIPEREQMYWSDIETQISRHWEEYQKARTAHIARAEHRAQEFGPKIYQHFERINRCHTANKSRGREEAKARCLERASDRYRGMIMSAGLGYVESSYWYIVEDVSTSENLANTALLGVLTGGVSTALQALDLAIGGNGGFNDKRYKYTRDPNHYQARFLMHPNFAAMFVAERGYPFMMGDFTDFRKHAATQVKLREHFKSEGLVLNENWTIADRKGFFDAVARKVKLEADAQWKNEMGKRGLNLPVNLTWDNFQLAPSVQEKIASKMNDQYVSNIRADWNRANFKVNVVDANIAKRTQEYLLMLSGSEQAFVDGQRYAEDGKQALRSVIVPPISMFLSLFLICMTLIKLPTKLIDLFQEQKESSSSTQPKPVIVFSKKLLKFVPVVLLLSLPVMLVENRYTQVTDSPVNYFLNEVEKSGNMVMSYALRWTLHAQPILHPVGLNLEASTRLYEGFRPVAHALAKIDINHAYLNLSQAKGEVGQTRGQMSSLKVISTPNDASVRIMNIKPKYREGIQLASGLYDIEVSAPGYRTKRDWYSVSADNTELKIYLERLVTNE